jgi:hypothetical protein
MYTENLCAKYFALIEVDFIRKIMESAKYCVLIYVDLSEKSWKW